MTIKHDAAAVGDGWETVPVAFEVLQVEPVHGAGRLVGLAVVQVEVAGIQLTLQGVRVDRGRDGRLTVQAPTWRHPSTGISLPAVLLPDELREAIGAEVLDLAQR